MSAGTISIQNGSMTVQGVGTKFTQDLKVGDYIVFKAGNTSYTIPVATIASDTALTTVFAHDGPNTTGAAWAALPAATQLMINATLHANMSRLMRIYGYDSDNWNKLLTVDDDVTIVNPDNSEYNGPSWLKIAKLAANSDFEAFQELAAQMHTEAQQVTTDKNTVVAKADAVESARSEVAANTAQVAQDKEQVSTDATKSAANAAAAAQSAAEAAQYDPTKSVTLRGEIPVADDLNTYAPNTTYRGVWYSLGGTLAKNFPVDSFIGTVEIFMVDSSGVQRATNKDGQQYFRWYTTSAYGGWVPFALGGANSTITSLTGLAGSLRLGGDGSNPNDAVTLKQMQSAIAAVSSSGGINGVMSTFIGDVSWWVGDGALLPTGYVAPNGQLSLRSDYPEVWSLIDAGVFRSTDEAAWNAAAATSRGVFTKGTVTSGASANFRWPDLNGVTSGSIGGLFLRGANAPGDAGGIGVSRLSAAPNIDGGWFGYSYKSTAGAENVISGSIQRITDGNAQAFGTNPLNTYLFYSFNINASRNNAAYGRNGATEVRPNSVSGYWIMRAKGTFSAQTDFGVFTSGALTANATIYGGTMRSVHSYAGGSTEALFRAKTITNSSSAVSAKSLEIGVAGGSGLIEVDSSGAIKPSNPAAGISTMKNLGMQTQASSNVAVYRAGDIVVQDFLAVMPGPIGQYNTEVLGGITFYTHYYQVSLPVAFANGIISANADLIAQTQNAQTSDVIADIKCRRENPAGSAISKTTVTVSIKTPTVGWTPVLNMHVTGY